MRKMVAMGLVCAVMAGCGTRSERAATGDAGLQRELDQLAAGFPGRVGIGVQDDRGLTAAVRGEERFSLQSVMKLIVAMAVMDAVDRQGWRVEDEVVVRREDLSLYVEPLAKLVTAAGYHTTVGELVRRAVVDSDSAAADILVRRLGGPAKVEDFLKRQEVSGVRFDRDERHLQTEIVGLEWRAEFVDPAVLQQATDAVPEGVRDVAYQRYMVDARDTATPRGMAELLQKLAEGRLLSARSTVFLTAVMRGTVTFPDRLKAGVPAGWTIGHKTGSSGSWKGMTAATNDVGILTAPDGRHVSVAVFVADTRAPLEERAKLMAAVARVVARYEK
jgi:beta-lactamase class A